MSDPLSTFELRAQKFVKVATLIQPLGNGEIAEMAEPGESEASSDSPFVQYAYALHNNSKMMLDAAIEMKKAGTDISGLTQLIKDTVYRAAIMLDNASQGGAREPGGTDMNAGAKVMYESTQANDIDKLIEGNTQLAAGALKYGGGANQYIAAEEYIFGAQTWKINAFQWKDGKVDLNTLPNDTSYIYEGAEWTNQGSELYLIGAENFQDGSELFPAGAENTVANSARNVTGAAEDAYVASEIYKEQANPAMSAEVLGSNIMYENAEGMLHSAQVLKNGKIAKNPGTTTYGAEQLNQQAEQVVGGAEMYYGNAEQSYGAPRYGKGAGLFKDAVDNSTSIEKASKFIMFGAENYDGGTNVHNLGAEITHQALQTNAEDLITDTTTIKTSADKLAAENSPGAEQMAEGANIMLNAVTNNISEFEVGYFTFNKGAEEYIAKTATAKATT